MDLFVDKTITIMVVCNPFIPGEFALIDSLEAGNGFLKGPGDVPLYNGKVIILMDERSMSQPEFTIMALRNAPNSIVLGTPSIGADGNVMSFKMPGNVKISTTGLSIFYPDGRQTQRVGLEPDVYLSPTIEGLSQGRDELIEGAISIIQGE